MVVALRLSLLFVPARRLASTHPALLGLGGHTLLTRVVRVMVGTVSSKLAGLYRLSFFPPSSRLARPFGRSGVSFSFSFRVSYLDPGRCSRDSADLRTDVQSRVGSCFLKQNAQT